MAKVSFKHHNRKQHNWLMYTFADKLLADNIPYYKGELYDLGCGEAPYREFFQKHVTKYVGVDWSACIHTSKADIVADLNKPLPIDSNVADTIISLSVMEHLCEPQIMLNEAYRILKPGGTMIIQVPWQWWIHEAPHDYFRYTPYALKYMFGKAGFNDVNVMHQSGFFSMWLLKFNYFTKRLARGPKPLKFAIQALLIPIWYFNQCVAPLLDKLDPKPQAESVGFVVRATK
jgi:SAM-dependent methyltransferase